MKHEYDFSARAENSAAAFGRFDGMHIGHREVLRKLAAFENSVVISFAENRGEFLYTEEEKEFVLESLGIGRMISVPAEIYEPMALSVLIGEHLAGRLGVKTIIAGENCERAEELKEACARFGVELITVPAVKDNGTEVTTSLVRSYFPDGNMDDCLRLLGGSYVMTGPVVHGKGAGRKHAMPTANLKFAENKIWPVHGVYGTVVHTDGDVRMGMTNIGLRPSDDSLPTPTCETFIPDFHGDLYGKTLTVEAFSYVRPVMRFRDLDEVREQIDRDIRKIKESF